MKWETVRRRVADEVSSAVAQGRHAQELILQDLVSSDFAVLRALPAGDKWHGPIRDTYAIQVRNTIDKWDIRAASRLRDLFCDAFPASLRRGHLMADQDAAGDWILYTQQ